MIREILTYAIYIPIIYAGLKMVESQDPGVYWPLKFLGFFAWLILTAKVLNHVILQESDQ